MPKKIKAPYIKARKETEKDFKKKIGLFDKLGDNCLTCDKPFDKTDVEQVSKWKVVVKGDVVNTYCPECFDAAIKVVEDFNKRVQERLDGQGEGEGIEQDDVGSVAEGL